MSSALTIALSIHATKANVKSMMNRKKSSTSSDMKTGGVRKISVREIDDSAQFLWERKSHQDIEKMRELARTDEFSDSESDGVASEIDSEPELPVDDINHQELDHDIILVSSQQKEAATDDWMLVDKSPTFESVVKGTNNLEESWLIHTTPSSQPTYFNHQ